jgi:tripeptide aminopeptidase
VSHAAAVNADALLRDFLDLVGIDSPTGHEAEIGELLRTRFLDLGCSVERDPIGNLVAVYPGTREGTVLVATHMDTAGTDRGVVPIVDDGVIHTDGTTILGADDKSGIAGCLELLRVLGRNPSWSYPTIELVVTVGEERGLVGSRYLDVGRLRATHGFVLDTAGPIGSVTYWSPTSVYLTVTVHGRKAHAGVEPEKGVNAVKVAAEALVSMPMGRIDEETVANVGTIAGGEARNVVPGSVVLEGMARSHDQGKLDRQLDTMREAFEEAAERYGATVDVVTEEVYPTYKIAEDAVPYREAAAGIRSLGRQVIPRKSGGGTDGNVFNAKGIPCVALSTGMVDEHATSEHIAIADLVGACEVLVAIVASEGTGEQR